MAETTNYKLYLTDSDAIKFLEWREKLCGQTDSNMTKIDAALALKADGLIYENNILRLTSGGIPIGEGFEIVSDDGETIIIDTEVSDTSENAVQNKIIKAYIDSLIGDVGTAISEINSILGGES